jgi:hypothetical protein
LVKQIVENKQFKKQSNKKNRAKDAWYFKNRNMDMPLITAKDGRFPWARLQPFPSLRPGSSARAVPT